MVLSDVAGRHAHVPWHLDELTQAFGALLGLARTPIPEAREDLPKLDQEPGDAFGGWARIRADNILITPDNGAILVDWPWACIGAGWVDALSVLVNVRVFDATADVDSLLESHPVFASATENSINGPLSGRAACFVHAARQPAPPGLPTLRAFQQEQGEAVIDWLHQRLR
ncbi:MAG: hypothetical protein ABI563_07755 [Specibacter sp.]